MSQYYALANPVEKIVGKSKYDFNRNDMIKVIETNNIERISFHYTALDGQLKELKIPVVNRQQAEIVLAEGERVDGSSLFKGMVDASLSDLYVVPVYQTAFINPFYEKSLDFVCRYMTKDGERAPYALDNILYNADQLFKKNHGLDLYALGELEFFLISEPQSNLFPASKQRNYHASAPFVKSGRIINEMVRYIAQITGSVKYAHSEVGYVQSVRSNCVEILGKQAEQLEIEFLPTPVTEAADNLVISRWLIRNTAFKHNCLATFTPKIEEGIAGNGMHVHMELRKNGQNVMTDKSGKLSEFALKSIGGLCHFADTLTAFGNTVSSAYLRLVPNQEAPTKICWSDMNRSAMIRVPLGWANTSNLASKLNPVSKDSILEKPGRQTVELRSPDGSAITHLLLAGITMAVNWGLINDQSLKLANDLYVQGNIFKNQDLLNKLPSLPKSCVESSKILLEKRNLYEQDDVFPESIINYVAKSLKSENDETINFDLADIPADDRLLETRKIMHKDLHKH